MKNSNLLFIKNIARKKNSLGYLLAIFTLLMGLLLLKTFKLSLEEEFNKKYNSLSNRIIKTEIIEDENFLMDLKNNNYVLTITKNHEEEILEIVVDDYKNIHEITSLLNGKYDYLAVDINKNDDNLLLTAISVSLFVLNISTYIIIIITIIQFNNDDKKTTNILRRIGYSKTRLFFTQIISFYTIFCCTFLANIITEYLLNNFIRQHLFIPDFIIKEYLKIFFNISIIIVIIYYFYYYILNKRKLKCQ